MYGEGLEDGRRTEGKGNGGRESGGGGNHIAGNDEWMKISLEGNINLGQIFSKMRNEIGHGHPKDLDDIHAYTYQLARCMIYVMILDNTGISHDAIKRIIHKIF